ncbi:TPA: IS30 family transposase, partial [Staphylococcus aureus]|nr:IS30 family transposase [Staphylococcus aureus]
MSYNHLTLTERARIEVLRQENYSLRSIARKLKRSVSTISREISRNNLNQSYQAKTAQKNYETKRKLCGRPTRFTPELGNIIKYYLKCHWSPEQIVGRLLQNQICFKTIYRWINSNMINFELISCL